jgi:hypothetical protein
MKKPKKELWTDCRGGTVDTRRLRTSLTGLFCLMAGSAVGATAAVCYQPAPTYFSSMTVMTPYFKMLSRDCYLRASLNDNIYNKKYIQRGWLKEIIRRAISAISRQELETIFNVIFCWLCIVVYQYSKTNEMHFLYSIYYELTAYVCFEHYLLIFRRHCTNNNWYTACVLSVGTHMQNTNCCLCSTSLRCASSDRNIQRPLIHNKLSAKRASH